MTENQIKSIVEEVMAKMQLSGNTSGMHGVFSDMNTAIAKAKEAQKIVRVMSMDQREKIISKMREKIRHLTEKLPLYYSVQRVFSGETEKKLR